MERKDRVMSRKMTVSLIATISLASACTSLEVEPTSDVSEQPLLVDSEFIRGFIADGTGCRTVGDPIVIGNSVTFILTDYTAELDGRGLARATCDLAVEIALPPGLTISLDDVVYRGFADGEDARTTFYREYFFAGQFIGDRRFTVQSYNATGAVSVVQDDSSDYTQSFGEFTALDEVLSAGLTRCGQTVVWRANTALSVRNTKTTSFSMASIDTVDVRNQRFVTFDFGTRPCR
jgi:hypothetical protein